MAMMKIKPLMLLLILTTLLACEKGSLWNREEGVLKDYSGLDGCTWVIESDSRTYEPLNLAEFDIALEDGKKVKFSFDNADDIAGSICMVGEIIRIKKIKAN